VAAGWLADVTQRLPANGLRRLSLVKAKNQLAGEFVAAADRPQLGAATAGGQGAGKLSARLAFKRSTIDYSVMHPTIHTRPLSPLQEVAQLFVTWTMFP